MVIEKELDDAEQVDQEDFYTGVAIEENWWNHEEASALTTSTDAPDLAMRVHSSQLLGLNPKLVLHRGGNTSVKARVKNFFGKQEDIIYIKDSGWDLATIQAAAGKFQPQPIYTSRRHPRRHKPPYRLAYPSSLILF